MPHSAPIDNHYHSPHRDPEKTNAYLIGGGIASLAAATFLIHDANVPASQIHILESSPVAGGSMDGSGSPATGYVVRGGRMLNFSYRCLYDLLATIPSLTNPEITVLDEISMFNAVKGNKTHANARLVEETRDVTRPTHGHHPALEDPTLLPSIVDVKDYGLSVKDREDLVRMMLEGEKRLERMKIETYFEEEFFHTNFWLMWATMYVPSKVSDGQFSG